ncbi:hypothetical protein BOTBODRAFT_192637 [Botryobasidium botryosum FD-172 SS1]|uniref:CRA domain-containing protein n=1 Tax=Botryobasidium botryosum (strain FD-172 SS1) TaxID=930990 RepID=A0A067LXH2_BOTB1|nr:hypothetical protein BOTBODRAFT_192637 [Botryobasidium botryosum FD-172 SS1]
MSPLRSRIHDPFASSRLLRQLVLSYLCHHCYANTAQVFAEESRFIGEPIDTVPLILAAFGHRNEDDAPTNLGGAEIAPELPGDAHGHGGEEGLAEDTTMEDWSERRGGHEEMVKISDLHDEGLKQSDSFAEAELKHVALRKQIREDILAGDITGATAILNSHFPAVLSCVHSTTSACPSCYPLLSPPPSQPGRQPFSPVSLSAPHLSLNLKIQSFIESIRNVPTAPVSFYSEQPGPTRPIPALPSPTVLSAAQDLFRVASSLPNSEDRATYLKELGNVAALIAYPSPETSPVAFYLSMERREAVASQINSAILLRSSRPPVPYLEHYMRQLSFVLTCMHETNVKIPATKHPLFLPLGVEIKADVIQPFDLRKYMAG